MELASSKRDLEPRQGEPAQIKKTDRDHQGVMKCLLGAIGA